MAFRHAAGPKAGKWEVEGVIVRDDRPKAVLLKVGDRSQWLPRAKVSIEDVGHGRVAVVMSEWLARSKGYV